MQYKAEVPCDVMKKIVSTLKRVATEKEASRSGRLALSFIKLEVIPRGHTVDFVATACNGYIVGTLNLSAADAVASEPFTAYFQPFPYRPGRANVLKDKVTLLFDDVTRQSQVVLRTTTGTITYQYNCAGIVDEYAKFDKTISGLYKTSSEAKKTSHYLDPMLLKSTIASLAEVYNKSMRVSIPEEEIAPVEFVSTSTYGEKDEEAYLTILQLPLRGDKY